MWPDDAIALPTRDGQDVGGAQERTMLAFAGGAAGIRTVEEINPDGSITRLRTRQGRPTFETEGLRVISGSVVTQLRGFVAKIPGGRAVLFDPYTMEILKTPYTPAAKLYEVQDFLTESTWYDVVLFDGTTIKVNAKAMPRLGITANHGYEAIPHVINYTVGDQYGNAERNTTEKRVFAVGRYSVTSWGGGGVTETLTPTEPRTESRALTIGQRIDRAMHTAWLGQMYHGAEGWDGATEWYFTSAEVTMLLASAYLVKVAWSADVAQPACSLASIAGTSPSSNTPTALPVVELCAVGVGEASNSVFTPDGVYEMFQWARWPARETFSYAVPGSLDITGTASHWYGEASQSNDLAGRTVVYIANNSLTKESNSETYTFAAFSAPMFSSAGGGTALEYEGTYYESGGGYYTWPTTSFDLAPRSSNGTGDYDHTAGNVGVSASYITSTQIGSFISQIGATSLAEVSFTRYKESGDKVVPQPITGRFADDLADPYRWFDQGSGWFEQAASLSVNMSAANPLHVDVIGKRPPLIEAKVAEIIAAGKFYDNDNDFNSAALYTGLVSARTALDNQVLTWSTVDYLLFDDINDVYISIDSDFSGSQAAGGLGSATLTVLLKVQTRHHTTTQTLGVFSYTYGEMLVEREIGTSGKYAVPSPQIRAIFAPLYQEQGSFKGAHYVTLAEEDGGIAAFHGFNFVLSLRMYSDFDTCNDDNAGQQVYFVPCNLLEMLYAFVFSTEYGVAEDGTRYPVTYTSRFNEMRDTLFATPVRVAVRDGVATNWTDTLGGDFAAVGTVTLHRT